MERERERGMERQIDRFIGEKRKKERQIEIDREIALPER